LTLIIIIHLLTLNAQIIMNNARPFCITAIAGTELVRTFI